MKWTLTSQPRLWMSRLFSTLAALAICVGAQAATPGAKAPSLAVSRWHSDSPTGLESRIGKSVIVLDFARTWYAPCRFQLLTEAVVQRKVGVSNITFVFVSNEPDWIIKDIRKQLPGDFVWYCAADSGNEFLKRFGIEPTFTTLPVTVVIDTGSRILWCGDAPDDFENMLLGAVNGTWSLAQSQRRANDLAALDSVRAAWREDTTPTCAERVAWADRLVPLELPAYARGSRDFMLRLFARSLFDSAACRDKYLPDILRFGRAAYGGDGQGDMRERSRLMADLMIAYDSLSEAIVYQKKAIAVATNAETKAELTRQLKEYERRQSARTGQPPAPDSSETASRPLSTPSTGEPSATLTSAQAIEDLAQLSKIIRGGYAGYDDADWKLRLRGSSWVERLETYTDSLRRRPEYTRTELLDLLADYLSPIIDEHFALRIADADKKVLARKKLTRRFSAYFTELRAERREGEYVVVAPKDSLADLAGSKLIGLGVANATDAEPNVPYLFPTLSQRVGVDQYLVGCFLTAKDSAARLTLTFRTDAATLSTRELPLHRGRVKDPGAGAGDAWSFEPKGKYPFPILRVRTAVEEQISADFWQKTSDMRREGNVILDLRANLGGGDLIAMKWCGDMCPGKYWMAGGNSIVAGGSGNPRSRWNPMVVESARELKGSDGNTNPNKCFRGTMYVILDENVASSGETFAALARQVPGAVWVGENSRGCVSYGNADIVKKLNNSGIDVRFGGTRFAWAETFPIREGVGFFPEYWLDTSDPYSDIANYTLLRK